jgi:hypothetical protein
MINTFLNSKKQNPNSYTIGGSLPDIWQAGAFSGKQSKNAKCQKYRQASLSFEF